MQVRVCHSDISGGYSLMVERRKTEDLRVTGSNPLFPLHGDCKVVARL